MFRYPAAASPSLLLLLASHCLLVLTYRRCLRVIMMEVSFSMLHSEGTYTCISMMHSWRKHASSATNTSYTAVASSILVVCSLCCSDLFPKFSCLKRHLIESMANCMWGGLGYICAVMMCRGGWRVLQHCSCSVFRLVGSWVWCCWDSMIFMDMLLLVHVVLFIWGDTWEAKSTISTWGRHVLKSIILGEFNDLRY
jgi:hypothetical protein